VSTPSTLDDYRDLLDAAFDERVLAWTAEAEATERFPRQLIEHLGAAGVFSCKWADTAQPDVAKLITLAAALGRLMSAGIGVGVSLHDSAIAILRRFGESDYLREICEHAIRGENVLCIGASEESGGSDLQVVETEIRARNGGFDVRGVKKFVSLSTVADHIMVVARSVDHSPGSRYGNVAVIAVPTSQADVQAPYRKVAAGPLATAAVHIDTWVPMDALVARAGTGLAAISWGLAHEHLLAVHAHLRWLRISRRRSPDRAVVARHETRQGWRRHRRGALGAGSGRAQTRLRQLRRAGRPVKRVERHPPVRHVVLSEEAAPDILTQPPDGGVAVIRIEHHSPALRVALEHAGHVAGQQ